MSRAGGGGPRRALILAVLAGALIAGGLADRATHPGSASASTPPTPVVAASAAAPADALSSSWFCAGATNTGGALPGSVVIANDAGRPVDGRVTIMSSSGASRAAPVSVGRYSSLTIPESLPGAAGDWVAAVVDMEGGSVAVEQVVDGGSVLGRSLAPCATSASPRWYFPTGQTRINAGEEILLLNPYATPVVADLSFTTDQGVETPVDLQGITVPANGLYSVDVDKALPRRSYIAATVSARSGGIVAWQASWVTPPPQGAPLVGTPAASAPLADPALPVPGVSVSPGAPQAATRWTWPDGLAGGGVDEQYVVYDPSGRAANVRLSVSLSQGAAEPLSFSVGPGQVVPIVSAQQARIPAGVPHSATLVSLNGVPVVAARSLTVDTADAKGTASLLGSQYAARAWVVVTPASDPGHSGQVVVSNPGSFPEGVRIIQLDAGSIVPVPGVGPLTVPPRGRLAVTLPAGQQAPVVVRAAGPVYVEYNLAGIGSTSGISASMAVPLAS
jgi:hypothetical protein